jgi:hypothetical protein
MGRGMGGLGLDVEKDRIDGYMAMKMSESMKLIERRRWEGSRTKQRPGIREAQKKKKISEDDLSCDHYIRDMELKEATSCSQAETPVKQ